jgi:hypothetical protein
MKNRLSLTFSVELSALALLAALAFPVTSRANWLAKPGFESGSGGIRLIILDASGRSTIMPLE